MLRRATSCWRKTISASSARCLSIWCLESSRPDILLYSVSPCLAAAAVRAATAEGDRVAMALGEARAVRSVGMAATGVMEEAWVVGRGWAALAARTG